MIRLATVLAAISGVLALVALALSGLLWLSFLLAAAAGAGVLAVLRHLEEAAKPRIMRTDSRVDVRL